MPKVVEYPRNNQVCKPLKTPPKHLKGAARAKWNELMRVLHPSVATDRQKDAILQYCETWALYRQCCDALETEPAVVINQKTGAQQPSAWTKLRIESHKTLFSLGLKLGLVPNGKDIPGLPKAPRKSKFEGLLGGQ